MGFAALSPSYKFDAVGWAERSEAHRFPWTGTMMGFAALSPSYKG